MAKHVAVLMGGWSAEREVSLRSGQACADALGRLGYRITTIDVTPEIAVTLEPVGEGSAPPPAASQATRFRVTVVDHGPGIPAADRDRIFEMFNQVSGGGRAGLGLPIARAFVEAHGQHLRFEETPGGGATFTFSMPAAVLPVDVTA